MKIPIYIHQLKSWPNFSWDNDHITKSLLQVRGQQGRLLGAMESVGFCIREEAVLETITQDVVKSSEIEGEILDQTVVRSSVARHLGMESAAVDKIDRHVDGVVEMMLDATQRFHLPLTKERLLGWHASLFPTGRSGFAKIRVGEWRAGPVQVVSGRMGKEIVHFEGPPAAKVEQEMDRFFRWLSDETMDSVLKAAIAHLWFVTIHPFDDGNGRIGRAIVDLFLARSENDSNRFYSLSAQIQAERKDYYAILERTQKGDLDITPWIQWFLGCLERAIEKALRTFNKVTKKARYWDALSAVPVNERQRKVINLMLEGFEGKLTSSKWATITKCSQDTAYRDIVDLVERGILIKNPEGGRNTSYSLVLPNDD